MSVTPAQFRAALDTDDVRSAVADAILAATGRKLWYVDEATTDAVRMCTLGQPDTVCVHLSDGTHLHVTVDQRPAWKESR